MRTQKQIVDAARQKDYRDRNKEKVLTRERAWDVANREKRNAISRAWRERNREAWLESKRASHAKHRAKNNEAAKEYKRRTWEARVAHEKAYYEKHPEKASAKYRAYRQRHPEKVVESTALRRARMNGGKIAKFTAQQLRERLAMFGNRCWMCGKTADQVDHVIPLARGGPHVLANLRPACGRCNRKKGAKAPRDVLT